MGRPTAVRRRGTGTIRVGRRGRRRGAAVPAWRRSTGRPLTGTGLTLTRLTLTGLTTDWRDPSMAGRRSASRPLTGLALTGLRLTKRALTGLKLRLTLTRR